MVEGNEVKYAQQKEETIFQYDLIYQGVLQNGPIFLFWQLWNSNIIGKCQIVE